jgi:hypothetical protein
MDARTVGIVFLKSKEGKVKELNKNIVELCNGLKNTDCQVDLAVSTTGPYDCILAIRGNQAESISTFVLEHLREGKHDVIADSQTFIGWSLYNRTS